MKKARAESVLATLPEERQAEIFSRLTVKTPTWPDTGYGAVKAWLAEDGLKTSVTALHRFFVYFSTKSQLADNANVVETVLADLKKATPNISQEDLDRAGQMFFSAMAIQQKDSLSWKRAQNVRQRDELTRLDREKFQFDAAAAALAKSAELKVISASKMSDTEKIQAARRALFGVLAEEAK